MHFCSKSYKTTHALLKCSACVICSGPRPSVTVHSIFFLTLCTVSAALCFYCALNRPTVFSLLFLDLSSAGKQWLLSRACTAHCYGFIAPHVTPLWILGHCVRRFAPIHVKLRSNTKYKRTREGRGNTRWHI